MMFVEPSFLINLYAQKATDHQESVKIFQKLDGINLVISYMVIAEVLTVLRKLKQEDITVENAYNSMIREMIVIDDTSYYEKSFKACLVNEIGFFDNVYHILMKDLKIKDILSFDHDFDIFDDIRRISSSKHFDQYLKK
jgi:predicted nucleic acid-binding protein